MYCYFEILLFTLASPFLSGWDMPRHRLASPGPVGPVGSCTSGWNRQHCVRSRGLPCMLINGQDAFINGQDAINGEDATNHSARIR
ncbi:unnamed protein product [Caenorhabditis sp. 36 PRJEB53466]|nr:unnamed protein product [Caenorhabditis sp. 36 PRJEB53466]